MLNIHSHAVETKTSTSQVSEFWEEEEKEREREGTKVENLHDAKSASLLRSCKELYNPIEGPSRLGCSLYGNFLLNLQYHALLYARREYFSLSKHSSYFPYIYCKIFVRKKSEFNFVFNTLLERFTMTYKPFFSDFCNVSRKD